MLAPGTQSAQTLTFSGALSGFAPISPPYWMIQPSRRFGFGEFVAQSMRPGNEDVNTGVLRLLAPASRPSTWTPPEMAT